MSRKIFVLFALTTGLFISAHASENVNTPENRQFLKQQETLSQQLREKPDTQLQAWAEQQVRANPLQHSDNQFLDELVRKQQAAQKDKPQQGAVYFVSFSIPDSRRGAETDAERNPALRYSGHTAGHGEQ
ncbi:conjugal transfer pilus assembly protein TrbC [Escherichia coli]|nr:conjugal transfer pilus assembly protein TrbC [Escherichia coli]